MKLRSTAMRGERRVVLVSPREVDLWVGGAAWLVEDVGETEGAFAEPVAEHAGVTAGDVDDAPFGGDEPAHDRWIPSYWPATER